MYMIKVHGACSSWFYLFDLKYFGIKSCEYIYHICLFYDSLSISARETRSEAKVGFATVGKTSEGHHARVP